MYGGRKISISEITEEDDQAGMGKDASDSISESSHTSLTHSLNFFGTIQLDSAAREGQTCANNDFGCDHGAFVNYQKHSI